MDTQLIQGMMDDLNSLSLTGLVNWEHGLNIARKLIELKKEMDKQAKIREEAYQKSLEEAKKRREQLKMEAKERGEEILGGETILVNADGSQEVLIP